jgi:hypothetical protein
MPSPSFLAVLLICAFPLASGAVIPFRYRANVSTCDPTSTLPMCSGAGTCDSRFGLCACDPGRTGAYCDVSLEMVDLGFCELGQQCYDCALFKCPSAAELVQLAHSGRGQFSVHNGTSCETLSRIGDTDAERRADTDAETHFFRHGLYDGSWTRDTLGVPTLTACRNVTVLCAPVLKHCACDVGHSRLSCLYQSSQQRPWATAGFALAAFAVLVALEFAGHWLRSVAAGSTAGTAFLARVVSELAGMGLTGFALQLAGMFAGEWHGSDLVDFVTFVQSLVAVAFLGAALLAIIVARRVAMQVQRWELWLVDTDSGFTTLRSRMVAHYARSVVRRAVQSYFSRRERRIGFATLRAATAELRQPGSVTRARAGDIRLAAEFRDSVYLTFGDIVGVGWWAWICMMPFFVPMHHRWGVYVRITCDTVVGVAALVLKWQIRIVHARITLAAHRFLESRFHGGVGGQGGAAAREKQLLVQHGPESRVSIQAPARGEPRDPLLASSSRAENDRATLRHVLGLDECYGAATPRRIIALTAVITFYGAVLFVMTVAELGWIHHNRGLAIINLVVSTVWNGISFGLILPYAATLRAVWDGKI